MSEDAPSPPDATGVVVVGGGFAGLCAAIEARLAGAEVTLLEAAPARLRGGNARHSRNIRLANAAETAWQRDSYPVSDFEADLIGMGCPDPLLATRLAEASEALGPWLAAQGVAFEPWADGNLPYSRKTRFFRGGGQALTNALYVRAVRLGVTLRYGCRMVGADAGALRPDAAGPVLLDIETPEGRERIAAAAVVLAAGGYGGNRPWLAEGLGPGAAFIANRGTPFQSGEPLRWLLDQGAAAVGTPGDGHLVAVDARAPRDDAGIVSRVDGMPCGIVVGGDGRRVHDEGATVSSARYSTWGRVLAARDDPRAWLILDACGAAMLPPMLYPPIAAESPEALARHAGVDPAGLATALAEVNAFLAGGPAPNPPRSLPGAGPLAPLIHPPFAAIPMQPGLSFTRHGVAVDAEARVQLADGGAAPRIFAAGATMAGAVLGRGYVSGVALTIGGVFGRIAGRNAAALAGRSLLRRVTVPGPDRPSREPPKTPADSETEARRTLNICNTCGYCTGLCDVFPAAQLRAALTAGDLGHLAHLCHDCRSCYYDCQYAPPHEFAVNVPAALAEFRGRDYRGPLPQGPSTGIHVLLYLACTLGVPLAVLLLAPVDEVLSAHRGPGAFYAVIPHGAMTLGATLGFGGALAILAARIWLYWRRSRGPAVRHSGRTVVRAALDVLRLRNLGGAGPGCETARGPTGAARRWFHHLVAYGFALTFLATLSGALLHHGLDRIAPYSPLSLPVVLGTLGGLAMLAGLAGLEFRRKTADRAPASQAMERADRFLRAALAGVAATGLALLAFRDGPAMGLLLALHLGTVLGLAVTLPFGKLSHGAYRAAALLRSAAERAARSR